MSDNQVQPSATTQSANPAVKWRTVIGVILMVIGMGLGGYFIYYFFGHPIQPISQPPVIQPADQSEKTAAPKPDSLPAVTPARSDGQASGATALKPSGASEANIEVAERGYFEALLEFLEDNGVVLGLLLAALGLMVSVWGFLRRAKPAVPTPGGQSIHQQIIDDNGHPVAVQQSGEGNVAHVGDVYLHSHVGSLKYAEQYGQAKELIESFLRRLEKEGVPPEKWGDALDNIVEEYRKFQAQAAAFQTDDTEMKRLINESRELAEQGRLDEVFGMLEQARRHGLDSASVQRKIKTAEVTAMQALLMNTERRFLSAARLFEDAADLAKGFDENAADDYLLQAANAYHEQGEHYGDNQSLEKSAAICRALLARTNRERYPVQWGRLQGSLGNALFRLGERESDPRRLEQAVRAYREALDALARSNVPLDWAMTQNNLGSALQALGEREPDTERLEQAVAAYQEALKEWTREQAPLQWAMTQTNLGGALYRLGQRESGTARLEQSMKAYRLALAERTRERAPLEWAATQNNLGSVLQALGERESGTERLEQSIVAYGEALKEWTREKAPLDWAATQNNLGNALQTLGEREPGTERLEQAVAAYEEALKERTRERVPLDWAVTQNNLGGALLRLGERESGTKRLEQAARAFREALKERTRKRVPMQWAATQNNLGNALSSLGVREPGTERLEQAVQAYEEALKERTWERGPLDWAMTQNNLGGALHRLGKRVADPLRLEKAEQAYLRALDIFISAKAQYFAENTSRNLAHCRAMLAKLRTAHNKD